MFRNVAVFLFAGILVASGCTGSMETSDPTLESDDLAILIPPPIPVGNVLPLQGTLSAADIGPFSTAGSFTSSLGTLKVSSSGADIWGASDALYYVYQPFKGDGEMIARVASQPNTNAWAKAGIMIRQSVAAGAPYAFMGLTPGNGTLFQLRATTGASSQQTGGPAVKAPYWVRLVRAGTSFSGFVSVDGSTWTPVGKATIPMGDEVLAGLAVTSHSTGVVATVTFTDVSAVSASAPPPPPPANVPPTVALTSPAAAASFTAPASIAMAASASDSDGTIARVDFLAGSTIVGTALASPFQANWSGAAAGTYALTAKATDNAGASTTSAPVSITINPAPVASAWKDQDIGSTGAAGSFASTTGTLAIMGAGADIWGSSDAFHFAYVPLAGDGEVVARVVTQQNTNAWAKAGVMIRESVATGSRHAFMALTPSNGAAFQRRSSTNGGSQNTSVSGIKAPNFVRLVRAGNLFSAFTSADGLSWRAIGSATIAMPSGTLAGLAVTSHKSGTLSKATFTDVQVKPAGVTPPPPANVPPTVAITSPASGATFTAPASLTVSATAADSDGSIAKVEFFQGSTLIGTDTASPFQASLSGLAAGTFSLTAKATDNLGATAGCGAVTITVNGVQPPANVPPTVAITSPASGATFTAPASLTVSATAADSDGSIAKVEFFQGSTLIGTDTASPFQASLSGLAAGTFSLTAKATDNLGATAGCGAVTITVNGVQPPANVPPTVAITSPASGATFTAPASLTISATAADSDGSIAKVEFFQGSTLIGTDTASPFQASLSGLAAGTFSLTAKATDNLGATAGCGAVTITVNGVQPPPPPDDNSVLKSEVFNASSTSMKIRWTAPAGATAARLFLAPEPPPSAGARMPAEKQVATLSGTATEAQVTGLAPAVDVFLRLEVDTPSGTLADIRHGRTLGGPREPLDNTVREVHAFGPKVLQVVLFNGNGATFQAGPWTVTRSNGTAINVTKVSRQSIPISAPSYKVGYGLDYSDSIIDADHRIYLTLDQALGAADLLTVKGPGVSFLLPFSDRYLETPIVQLNQVAYNPRATERFAYVSGWMGDGGGLSLAELASTADILAEPVNADNPRTTLKSGLAITQRATLDPDTQAEVRQIDLSSVAPAEGVRMRIRIPGVGVSWPTQISEKGFYKAYFTIARGLFFNRWGADIKSVMDEFPRPNLDHPFVYTSEGSDFDAKFSSSTPLNGKRSLVGGYHDAGDFDQRPMHQVIPQVLLRAFELDPSRHLDGGLDIPEAGNGIPDLLDEALWGVNAWVQLQESDGGVRMGVESTRHPWGFYHSDVDPLIYWTYSRCPQASARAAGLFAQASRLLAPFDPTRAADLRTRAISAFNYAKSNGAAAQFLMYGASELFRLTGDAQYDTAFKAAWSSMGTYGAFNNLAEFHLLFSDYRNPGQTMPDYFLGYVNAPGASADIKGTASTWLTTLANKWSNAVRNSGHAHRSPRPGNYNWDWGIGIGTARFMDTVIARMQLGGVSAADQQKYMNSLSLSADYVLGGNPNGLVYFTELGSRHVEELLDLDSLSWIKEGFGAAPGKPAYGPIESLPAASYMDATKAVFYPTFSGLPRGMRYGDVRTIVNTNEFSVWELSGPYLEMFAILAGQNLTAPAEWLTGGAHAIDPLP